MLSVKSGLRTSAYSEHMVTDSLSKRNRDNPDEATGSDRGKLSDAAAVP